MSISAINSNVCPDAERITSLSNRIKATASDGCNACEFRSERFPNSRLVIAVSESGPTVTLFQPIPLCQDGKTERITFSVSRPSDVSRFSYVAMDSENTVCGCGNGFFKAEALVKADSLAFSKISIDQSPSSPLAAYERTVILFGFRACQAAKRALLLLDEFLAAENLGFTAANLGFRY